MVRALIFPRLFRLQGTFNLRLVFSLCFFLMGFSFNRKFYIFNAKATNFRPQFGDLVKDIFAGHLGGSVR